MGQEWKIFCFHQAKEEMLFGSSIRKTTVRKRLCLDLSEGRGIKDTKCLRLDHLEEKVSTERILVDNLKEEGLIKRLVVV